MRTTSPVASKQLVTELESLIQDREIPSLNRREDNSFRVDSFTISNCPDLPALLRLIEDLAAQVQPKQSKYANAHQRQWMLLMANLCHATATNRWVGISGVKKAYTKGEYLHGLGLQYGATQTILSTLETRGLVQKVQGKKYANEPITNQYYPTKELQRLVVGCSLFAENSASFDKSFLSINEPDPQYENFHWKENHPDRVVMEEINEFARTQTWACKSAIKQVFKRTPFQSGRLITPFQNLQSRNYQIRINTLINGNPITEVDFNANHLRLFLAFNRADVIGGDDAYESIVHESGLGRDVVKQCVNIALNTINERTARYVTGSNGIKSDDYTKFSKAFSKLYPHLDIHAEQSLEAMQSEGMILRDVLHEGALKCVLALPVHDAVAVEAEHREWAVEAMTASWERWVGQWHSTAKASVK